MREENQEEDDHENMDEGDDEEAMANQMHSGEPQPEDQELEIEGGEEMVEGDDFPTEEEMINQNLTKEQIEQVLLLKKQQHQMAMQAAAEGQAPVGDGDEMYDEH